MRPLVALLLRLVSLGVGVALLAASTATVAALSGYSGALGLRWAGFALQLDPQGVAVWALPIGATALMGVAACGLAFAPTRSTARPVAMQLPGGLDAEGVRVTVHQRTLRALVRHEAGLVEGVREVHPEIRMTDEGWHIEGRLVVWRGHSMRALADAVAERLREALPVHTGVGVADLALELSLAGDDHTAAHRRALA